MQEQRSIRPWIDSFGYTGQFGYEIAARDPSPPSTARTVASGSGPPERQTGRDDMMRDGGSETGIRAALAGCFDSSQSVVTQMRGRLIASISSLAP
jgi:hypothetical protein